MTGGRARAKATRRARRRTECLNIAVVLGEVVMDMRDVTGKRSMDFVGTRGRCDRCAWENGSLKEDMNEDYILSSVPYTLNRVFAGTLQLPTVRCR